MFVPNIVSLMWCFAQSKQKSYLYTSSTSTSTTQIPNTFINVDFTVREFIILPSHDESAISLYQRYYIWSNPVFFEYNIQ